MPPEATSGSSNPSGAQVLLESLVANGVDTCFSNPGTTEMRVVAALDEVPGMRAVLALFEGVATGAADGDARVADRPAAALLHLGPGLANGLANLHNARRARSPVVVVGDHATSHSRLDAPLQSDIGALAGAVSQWQRRTRRASDAVADARDAVRAALGRPSGVATLVLPADVSWSGAPTGTAGQTAEPPRPRISLAPADAVDAAARALRSSEPAAILLGGAALRRRPVQQAAAVCETTGARLLAEMLPARMEHGAGIPEPERIAYLAELAISQLADLRHLVLVDAPAPVSFFAYPGVPGELWPPGCALHTLCDPAEDAEPALAAVAELVGAPPRPGHVEPSGQRGLPSGSLDTSSLAQAVGALLPEDAIVVDESNTAGVHLFGATRGAAPHDWLCLSGGAIGQGLPLATGAAMGGGGRPVVCLEADGSAMYTLQALWTQAREGLDVTTVVLANRSYAILRMELARVGAGRGGPVASSLLDLKHPELDMVSLARGMGVPVSRATTADELVAGLRSALATPGPALVEAVLPARL